MKKSFTIIVLALIASLAIAQTSVTFVVDENLAPIDEDALDMEDSQLRGSSALSGIFREEGVLEPIWIAKSFSDDERFYTFRGKTCSSRRSCGPMPSTVRWCSRPTWFGCSSVRGLHVM